MVQIRSKLPTKEYEEGWDRIYGSKSQQKRIEIQKREQSQQQSDSWDVPTDNSNWHEGE